MLSAGLDGLDKEMACPEPMSMDLYSLTTVEREEMDIAALPHDLFEAVHVAEHSEFLKTALGAEVHKKLMETKLIEADKFRLHVSEMDLREHLKL